MPSLPDFKFRLRSKPRRKASASLRRKVSAEVCPTKGELKARTQAEMPKTCLVLNNIFVFQFHRSQRLWSYTSRLGLPTYDAIVPMYNLVYPTNVQAYKHKRSTLIIEYSPLTFSLDELLRFSKNEYHKPSLVLSE